MSSLPLGLIHDKFEWTFVKATSFALRLCHQEAQHRVLADDQVRAIDDELVQRLISRKSQQEIA